MTTLEDSFLRDLEDLSDDSGAEEDDRDAAIPENDEVHVSLTFKHLEQKLHLISKGWLRQPAFH